MEEIGESRMDKLSEYNLESYEDNGKKYLSEEMLPPIHELLPTKFYMNVHPLAAGRAVSSSSGTMSECWDRLDYDDEEWTERVTKTDGAGEEVEAADRAHREEGHITYPLTADAIRKRELRRKENEDRDRVQIISTLEKQMVSLYNLKKQYQRNTQPAGCQKEVVQLPSVVVSDHLARQRNVILEKIKRQKVQDELKKQEQVERKLQIIKKLIQEQKSQEYNRVPNHKLKKVNIYKICDTVEERMNVDAENITGELDQLSDTIGEAVKTEQNYQDNLNNRPINLGFEKTDIETKFVEKEEAGSFEKGKTRKGSSKGKDHKKKNVVETENQNKTNKKKTSADEEPAAVCEEKRELPEPASQMQDLLLWFENWREKRKEESCRFEELERSILPEERCVELRPAKAVFKDVWPRTLLKQKIEVVNICEEALHCRVVGVQTGDITERTPLIEAWLEGPQRARTGNCWWLTVQLQAPGPVEDTETGVRLQFCRADGSISVLTLPVEVLTPRAEPRLNTACIRFVPQVFWTPDVFNTQLIITNTGGLNCAVSWTEEKPSPLFKASSGSKTDVVQMAREMIESAVANVFNVFRIVARQNQTVAARGYVSLPIQFRPHMTSDKGDVFTTYTFTFEGERVDSESQKLVVCGVIEDIPFSLEPALLDLGVCYMGGMVQQALVMVRSTARYACAVTTRLPRSLADCLAVVPPHTIVQARSSTTLAVRLVLSSGFLDEAHAYFDRASGLLAVSVLVYPLLGPSTTAPPPLELRVMAVVAPTCPLTIEPALLDLGTVSTSETAVADIQLINHQPFTYNYAFKNLPQGVQVEPGGGCGSIQPEEAVPLRLLFSPRACDLGARCEQPGAEGGVTLTLRCCTSIDLRGVQMEPGGGCGSILPEEAVPLRLLFSPRACDLGARCEQPGAEGGVTLTLRCCTSISLASPTVPPKPTPQKSMLSTLNNYYVNVDSTTKRITNSYYNKESNNYVDVMVKKDKEVQEAPTNSPDLSPDDSDDHDVTAKETKTKSIPSVHTVNGESNQILEPDYKALLEYYASYRINGELNLNEGLEEILCEDCRNDFDNGGDGDGFEANENLRNITSDENNKGMPENLRVNDEDGFGNRPTVTDAIEKESIDNETNKLLLRRKSEECVLPEPGQRYAKLVLQAYIVDPLVELSSQAVVLPPTHCNSTTIAPLRIRSKFSQNCRIHEKTTNFKTWFEFKSPSKFLYVEPRRGFLTYKQDVKVNIIFKPKITKKEIYDKAFEMKIESIKWTKIQELMDQYNQEQTRKQLKQRKFGSLKVSSLDKEVPVSVPRSRTRFNSAETKHGKEKKRPKSSIVTSKTKKTKGSLKLSKLAKKASGPLAEVRVDPAEVEVTAEDLGAAEVWLLKYLESLETSTTVSCLIVTELPSGIRRHEVLDCEVLHSIVAPTLALTSTPCLQFGATALGNRSRLQATVTSLSFFDEFVTISTLNPIGPFWCPIPIETSLKGGGGGLELPPEHTLTIPVLFEPTFSGEVNENFEIISGGTVVHLQASGEGVTPSLIFTPDQQVFTVTCAAGKTADVVIKIENTCAAPLHIKVKQDYLKEGSSLPLNKPQETPATSPKQKRKPIDKKKNSDQESITPQLVECLENDFVSLTQNVNTETIFQILNNSSIDIPSKEIRSVTVRFTPPTNKDLTVTSEERSQKSRGKSSRKSKKVQPGNTPANKSQQIKYKVEKSVVENVKVIDTKETVAKQIIATKYSVIFGNVKVVKEWIFLATIKK